jgi:hypothetical protein
MDHQFDDVVQRIVHRSAANLNHVAAPKRRTRGHIRELPSGSFQAIVYAGTDPLTGEPRPLRETAKTYAGAATALTRLQSQVDENRHPKSDITVGQAIALIATADTGSGYVIPIRRQTSAITQVSSRSNSSSGNARPPGASSVRCRKYGTSGHAAERAAPSLPTGRAAGLVYPLTQLRSLPLLQGGDLDVEGPVGGSEWRRGVEVRAAEEDDIHGNVVGGYLDDPLESW